MNFSVQIVLATALFASLGAQAQTSTVASGEPFPLSIQAADASAKRFDATQLKGKVAVVYYWSTACAVCRTSLPEMRANLNGWKDKPFALVTVNTDKRKTDWLTYERVVEQTQMPGIGLISLRLDDTAAPPAKLPLTLLVDNKGQVVASFEGRVAPEVWDGVAELMN